MDNLTRYLEDRKFIQWVFNPDQELEMWWESYESVHQSEKENIQLARKILNKFKTRDKELSVEDKILLFSNILKQIEEKKETQMKIRFLGNLLKYAAVAILFFSLGAVLFYKKDNFNTRFYTQRMIEPFTDNEAKIIRPGGENIILEEKKSVVEYRKDGQIVVNNNVITPKQQARNGAPELNTLIIPFGRTSEIVLPDRTKVYLNAGSRLVYPEYFADKNREVLLVGEAFFDVFEDVEHPFIVQTTDIRVKVLGTSFNVSAYPSDNIIETVLVKGKVKLEKNNSGFFSESFELAPDQLAAYNKTTGKANLASVETDNYILWKDGLFKFESTDLSRVVKKLERFYNIRFVYSDPLMGGIKISGKLELNENYDEIINRVAVAASVKISKKGENYYEIKQ